MTVQAGLCQTGSEPKLLVFSRTDSNDKLEIQSCSVSLADNAIPITSWFSDATDTALLCLLPLLDALRFCNDVRSVLSRNLHIHRGPK